MRFFSKCILLCILVELSLLYSLQLTTSKLVNPLPSYWPNVFCGLRTDGLADSWTRQATPTKYFIVSLINYFVCLMFESYVYSSLCPWVIHARIAPSNGSETTVFTFKKQINMSQAQVMAVWVQGFTDGRLSTRRTSLPRNA